ncbi:hypothetical protein EOD39_10026 [Acipenser ruthenus]|uniref:Uncharacterized protein n=1 Tax=Acipenser ruthenus TaxID=7906 RepID=A0A444TYV9_ACIRT|nr:hypothetical protein EOD39_10026 [Acipenser ruthenus]
MTDNELPAPPSSGWMDPNPVEYFPKCLDPRQERRYILPCRLPALFQLADQEPKLRVIFLGPLSAPLHWRKPRSPSCDPFPSGQGTRSTGTEQPRMACISISVPMLLAGPVLETEVKALRSSQTTSPSL